MLKSNGVVSFILWFLQINLASDIIDYFDLLIYLFKK